MPDLSRRSVLRALPALGLAALDLTRVARAFAQTGQDLYALVWEMDQEVNGIEAVLAGEKGDPARGYVVVDETGRGRDHALFPEVVIPERKRQSYARVAATLDNYRLDQTKPETVTPEETAETEALLDAVALSDPMDLVRYMAEEAAGRPMGDGAWRALVHAIWFRPFRTGRGRDLTGFEHVVLGEQNRSKVGGQHFWYVYHLADAGGWGVAGDAMDFEGTKYPRDLIRLGRGVPEVVTLAYRWRATDFATGEVRPLFKSIGGYWVGPSIEGLMALGTLRFLGRDRETAINGHRYEVKMFKSPDERSMRTFYPVYLGPA